ncbi:type II toxin-antitoxin system VapC family toxin [Candidatus Thiosymbion oneisti]|uniref:type II toxin-antitoxin system VapC family toxin n=1 Tax=Candidatus Thiosymbion oneisti TaxID=589554 RepID=UPI000AFA766E|nr:type II toxin-antitoxin system VapC family toxin [Candidatus Thiosymbion oneisti]
MYVIDTNTLIYFFKGIGNVPKRFFEVSPKEIAIPSIVLYELEYGIAKSTSPGKRQAQLKELCSLVEILPFGDEEARLSAAIRANLEKKGTPIGAHDILIAGTALANQGILVTNNTKEFSRVSKLKLENWYK